MIWWYADSWRYCFRHLSMIRPYLPASWQERVLRQKGKIVKSQGWKEAYENLETDEEWEEADDLAAAPKEQTLPSVKKGDSMPVAKVTVTTGKTTPPAYFTEATLLSAMENPVRYMESKDAKAAKTLGETGGLGTVATRADIIDKCLTLS